MEPKYLSEESESGEVKITPQSSGSLTNVWEMDILHPGRLTAGSPTNLPDFCLKDKDLNQTSMIMFHVYLRGSVRILNACSNNTLPVCVENKYHY